MENTLLINLGNNDIKIIEEKREKLKNIFSDNKDMMDILNDTSGIGKNYRKFTELLLEKIDGAIECVEFPIIKATMNKLKVELGDKKIDEVIIAYTDQMHTKEKVKDTIFLGKIIKQMWSNSKNFKSKLGINQFKQIGMVKLFEIKENPADYDAMRTCYYKKILELNKKEGLKELYINVTGGTQAMNTALLINAINYFKGNVHSYYTKYGEEVAEKLDISYNLKKENFKNDIKLLIKSQNYDAAETILDEFKNNFPKLSDRVELIINTLKSGRSRIQFAFEDAIYYILPLKDDSDNREFAKRIYDNIQILKNKNKFYLLNEVKNNAIFQYEKGAYTDFLGRVFRIQEEVYKLILDSKKIITINDKEEPRINKSALTSHDFEILNKIKIQESKLEYEDRILSVEAMEKIIEALLHDDEIIIKILNKCKLLKELKDCRNKSILAHGYEGISKEKIYMKLKNKEIKSVLDNIINEVIGAFNNNEIIYDDFYKKDGSFNNKLLELIEEL